MPFLIQWSSGFGHPNSDTRSQVRIISKDLLLTCRSQQGLKKTWRSLKSKNTLVAPNRAVTPVVKTYFLKVVNGVEHLLRENNSEDFELHSEVFHNETKEVVADGNYYMLTKISFQQLWIIVSEPITTRPILANHSASGNHVCSRDSSGLNCPAAKVYVTTRLRRGISDALPPP